MCRQSAETKHPEPNDCLSKLTATVSAAMHALIWGE
jgi:hypothetical protein